VAVSVDTAGRPGLSVTVSIPYEELQWIRIPAGYGAGVELTVVFQPRRGGRSYGDSWNRRIVAGSFEGSRSPSSSVTERRTFQIPAGRYEVRIEAHDVNSEATSSARTDLEVPDYSRVPVGFADLELGLTDSTGAFLPLPTRLY